MTTSKRRTLAAFRADLEKRGIDVEIQTILNRYAVTMDELVADSREEHIMRARADVCLYMHARYRWSQSVIAKFLGFDRTTIRSLIERMKEVVTEETMDRFGAGMVSISFFPSKPGAYTVNLRTGIVTDPEGKNVMLTKYELAKATL